MAAQEVVLLGQEIHLVELALLVKLAPLVELALLVELIAPVELVPTEVAFVFSGTVVLLAKV